MVNVGKYIENSRGEKAFIGDEIKMHLYVKTALGDSGRILDIREMNGDDAKEPMYEIEYDIKGIIQPVAGIIDFDIISKQ